jgi:hypothetical protein
MKSWSTDAAGDDWRCSMTNARLCNATPSWDGNQADSTIVAALCKTCKICKQPPNLPGRGSASEFGSIRT